VLFYSSLISSSSNVSNESETNALTFKVWLHYAVVAADGT
jgi:hypothetical protein